MGGVSLVWVVSLPGGGGGSPCPGGVLPVQGGFSLHPPGNRITHTCKNITLATTSLRPVTSSLQQVYYTSETKPVMKNVDFKGCLAAWNQNLVNGQDHTKCKTEVMSRMPKTTPHSNKEKDSN